MHKLVLPATKVFFKFKSAIFDNQNGCNFDYIFD